MHAGRVIIAHLLSAACTVRNGNKRSDWAHLSACDQANAPHGTAMAHADCLGIAPKRAQRECTDAPLAVDRHLAAPPVPTISKPLQAPWRHPGVLVQLLALLRLRAGRCLRLSMGRLGGTC